jgi:hypothetical protein
MSRLRQLAEKYKKELSASHGASHAAWAKRAKWSKWRSRIYLDGENVHLGYFDTPEQARAAHAAAVKAHLGERYLKSGGTS